MKLKVPKILTRTSLPHVLPNGAGLLAIAALSLYKLGPLTSGVSSREVSTIQSGRGWHEILVNPLNAPLLVPLRLLAYGSIHHIGLFRIASVLLGLISMALFVLILKRWYGQRAALFGLVLYATASFFLHVSRLVTPDVVLLVSLPALLVVHILINAKRPSRFSVLLWLTTLIALLYVPGLIWFIAIILWLERDVLKQTIATLESRWLQIVSAFIGLLAIVPLIRSFVLNPHLLKAWAGLPDSFPSPLHIADAFMRQLASIFVYAPAQPELHLGHLPYLSSLFDVLFIAGVLFYARHWQAPRSRLLALCLIIGLALSALGGPVNIIIILPVIMLIIVAGLAYLLHLWLSVFPRNPLARSLGIAMIAACIALSAIYGIHEYFIAWPNNPEAQHTFNHQLVLK